MTKGGKPVEDLIAKDFIVLSDGEPQTVRMISRDSEILPVYAVIVLQTDGSSEPALAKIKKTASLVSGYISNDMGIGTPSLAAVVTVSDKVKVEQDFTADPDAMANAFARIAPKGDGARLIDGVSLACDLLAARKKAARRVIVLISERHDQGSKARFPEVLARAQKYHVVVYTISYSAYTIAFTQKASDLPPPPYEPGLYDPSNHGGIDLLAIPAALAQLAKQNISEAFAEETGGAHEKFTTLRGLETQLITTGTEIHNRYTLTFVPPEPEPAGYHQLTVSVRKSGDWHVHARVGYWSGLE
jgi:VWFA-related protein